MLRIQKLNIDIETADKKFGREIKFSTEGLNIIKGDNHSGKSTIASAIFYALGMEELLGGKNTVAIDSILKNQVPYDKGIDLDIKTSSVTVEVLNLSGKSILLKRFVKHYDIESRIIQVIDGESIEPYFLHDPNSAQHKKGFFTYFENFLGLNLPIVPKNDGGECKLYLQTIFTSCFIEQITGWTDFFATIPYFGIKDAKKRNVEYILNLSTFVYEKAKNKYEDKKKEISLNWDKKVNTIKDKVNLISGVFDRFPDEVRGVESLAQSKYTIYFKVDEESVTLEDYKKILEEEKKKIESSINTPKSDIEAKIIKLNNKLKKSLDNLLNFEGTIKVKKNELSSLKKEKNKLSNEIDELTDLLKIKNYTKGIENTIKAFEGICPTCENPISPTLYKHIKVMGLQENKDYLKSQDEILKTYITVLEKEIDNEEKYYNQLKEEYEADKEIISYLEKDFISDKNLPSLATMKELVNIENKLTRLNSINKDLIELYVELKEIANEWDTNEKTKEPYEMSLEDNKKLKMLEDNFKLLLKEFIYGSKREDQIWISKKDPSKYFPMVKIGDDAPQPIKYNSSASDFVRSLWAYLISLYEVSSVKNGNHLGLFLFDEPAQHAMTESSQTALFKKLSKLNCQSLVFASFEDVADNQRDKFDEIVKGFKEDIKIIEIGKRAIIELENKE